MKKLPNGSEKEPWIEVVGGNKWYFGSDKNKLTLSVDQLGRALSHINRFGGHTSIPYSVAQHSVWVSQMIWEEEREDPALCLAALLHDAPEMIIGDIPTPFKMFLNGHMKKIKAEEDRAFKAIYEAMGVSTLVLNEEQHDILKKWDRVAVITEKRDFLDSSITWGEEFTGGLEAAPEHLYSLPAAYAAQIFTTAFKNMKDKYELSR